MKKAGVNTATVGVFSWSALEPQEGNFQFGWLHDIMDKLYENGIYTVLATPTGARPAWMDGKISVRSSRRERWTQKSSQRQTQSLHEFFRIPFTC